MIGNMVKFPISCLDATIENIMGNDSPHNEKYPQKIQFQNIYKRSTNTWPHFLLFDSRLLQCISSHHIGLNSPVNK